MFITDMPKHEDNLWKTNAKLHLAGSYIKILSSELEPSVNQLSFHSSGDPISNILITWKNETRHFRDLKLN